MMSVDRRAAREFLQIRKRLWEAECPRCLDALVCYVWHQDFGSSHKLSMIHDQHLSAPC